MIACTHIIGEPNSSVSSFSNFFDEIENDNHANDDELDLQFNIDEDISDIALSPNDQDLNEKAKKRNQEELKNADEDKDFTLNHDGEVKIDINSDILEGVSLNSGDINIDDIQEEEEISLDLNEEPVTGDNENLDKISPFFSALFGS